LRLVVIERIGPVSAPRIGLAGSEAFNRPAPIDLKLAQEGQALDVGPEVFLPFPNDQGNPFGPVLIPDGPKRHGCGKKKNVVMAKMDEFSRFFRNLFGFAPIEEFGLPPIPVPDHAAERHTVHSGHRMMSAHAGSDEDNNFHILPFMPGPVQGEGFPPSRSEGPNPPEFRGHRMWIHRHHRPHSFTGRLHKAFLTLSPWEGRALSFVIGCGIGVLLRMLYVFSVLAYRCFLVQPRLRLEDRQEEELAPAADATVQPLVHAPPPEYNEKGSSQ